ncbi:MAG: DUF4276 family protein [Anaerolineae bacterium]|nr:DUF4276 family protein [Anaerolineae bacterium]MDW8300257.1 DUF4276 family protein [Anaerolineae bacterium]
MTKLEILLEEQSAEMMLRSLVPKIVGNERARAVAFRRFRGKYALLRQLPAILKGYAARIKSGEAIRILVLLDQDSDDCTELKRKLEQIALDAGLVTRSVATADKPFQILNRIAIEELEAWYFGDIQALCRAYPKVEEHLGRLREADPDSISEASHALKRVFEKGYKKRNLSKIEVAERIAQYMQPERNRSRSFQVFREGLKACLT